MTDAKSSRPEATEAGFDAMAQAKRLLRTIRAGSLATLSADGTPFASLVNVATAFDGSPILILSQLAIHTGHLGNEERCSLLLAETGKGDPLAHPRLTLIGRARPDPDPLTRARFLRRHPKSSLYAGFSDFAIWRMEVSAAFLNGGFGRAATLQASEILSQTAGAEGLLAAEEGAVEHLNADHADALALYARHFAGEADAAWRATGLDPDGLDLVAPGARAVRIAFDAPVRDSASLRQKLVVMAKQARTALNLA